MGSEEVLQCVGRLEIVSPKPVGFLCGTLPVVADGMSFTLPHSALVPSSSQRMAAPRYQMLPTETDLNTLPLLPNIPETVLQASVSKEDFHWDNRASKDDLSRKCQALAVSGLAEHSEEIDVVAPTDIMKQIFKIPYSKAQLSIAVHRVGDCLILNEGPEVEEREKMFGRKTSQSKAPDSSIFLNFAMHSVRAEACDCPPSYRGDDNFVSSTSSQFISQSVKSSSAGEYSNRVQNKPFWDNKKMPNNRKKGPIQKASIVGDDTRRPLQDIGNNGFQRIMFWQFHNFRMLLGSDLLVFSNEKYVAVSLHLWDISRQVTPTTWLEAWLDNVMASVPELAICYHRNGVVQGYELLKTDDIFLLKGISEDGSPTFHPQIVQQSGLTVLRFLQDNCKQDPGAYWLYKDDGEDVIQLFNLSALPENHSPVDGDPESSLSSLMLKWRRNSLLSLGTTLYRVGHRMSLSTLVEKRAKCAMFFKQCLDVLCEQDDAVISAHAHEQYARLILNSEEDMNLVTGSFLLESEAATTDVEKDEHPISSSRLIESRNLSPKEQETLPVPRLLKIEDDPDFSAKTTDIVDSTQVEEISLVSSKLAAIYHVSEAIKSLRWHRQQQDSGNCIENRRRIHDQLPFSSICACGDADCIEVCDIHEWLPSSRMDSKMWKLVLLLGESYLALGEAYRDNGQLDQALTIVKLACSLYGSMPQHLEGSHFISSMVSSSSLQYHARGNTAEKLPLSDDFSTKYLFWSRAWVLVGDVYVEFNRREKKDFPGIDTSKKKNRPKLSVSEHVIEEFERLKNKLGQSEENCSTCSLINCSCRSDRATSGSSASSSYESSPLRIGGKPMSKKKSKRQAASKRLESHLESETAKSSLSENGCSQKNSPLSSAEIRDSKDAPEVQCGGIFRFLVEPRVGSAEQNLKAAISCYDAARQSMEVYSVGSAGLKSIFRKMGWVSNELGRHRLDKGDLLGAELAFSDAVKAFKKVSDHMNIILINCNLGHGRRNLAEELVSRMELVKDHIHAFKQLMKNAKMEYAKAIKYYEVARVELNSIDQGTDQALRNEALTQLAHTYLRLGMLLSKEAMTRNAQFKHSSSCQPGKTGKNDISPTDVFGRALSLYESLGELRRQEAAYAHFHLGCFHRDSFLLQRTSSKNGDNLKVHVDLAESHWKKSLEFYRPKTHPSMYLNILLEQSMLLSNLSSLISSSEVLASALRYLLEGRYAAAEEQFHDKYREHLLVILKRMTSSNSMSLKLREMYRLALKSTSLGQLHDIYRLWTAPD